VVVVGTADEAVELVGLDVVLEVALIVEVAFTVDVDFTVVLEEYGGAAKTGAATANASAISVKRILNDIE